MRDYLDKKILPVDPFQEIDRTGIGELMRIAVEKGRSTRPDIKIGICGEHGGDPSSIEFCNSLNFAYVSCSPFRVPIARLASARATVKQGGVKKANSVKKRKPVKKIKQLKKRKPVKKTKSTKKRRK
jgi:phosphoenolpyruvate-protein kinase (PTS system EI component)